MPAGPGGARSATSPWKPGCGSSATCRCTWPPPAGSPAGPKSPPADLEGFLACRAAQPPPGHLRDAPLLRMGPAAQAHPRRPGQARCAWEPSPGSPGRCSTLGAQRSLFHRWTSDATHPHERLAGLLALLHAASSAQIRGLAITGIDRPAPDRCPGRAAVPRSRRSRHLDRGPSLPGPPRPARHPEPARDRHEGHQDRRRPR